MKILIHATSSYMGKSHLIEVTTLEEAISMLLINKELVKSLVNEENSWLKDYTPREFVINIDPFCVGEKYDVELEIYDYYRE